MEAINEFFTSFSSFLWGWPMIILLLGTHIFLTVRLRFPQRKIFQAISLSFKKDKNATGDVSQFGALATALAATIGTGNIIGVATAIALGGPGAVFWCWLTGVFGISTKYAEGLLAVKYRVKTKRGEMLGGPMYALEKGLGWKWLGILFALFAALASFGIGSTVQANAISTLVENQYGISPYITGAIVTILGAAVIIGGVQSISKVCGMLVPFMAIFYVVGCIYILIVNHAYLLPALKVIFESAYHPCSRRRFCRQHPHDSSPLWYRPRTLLQRVGTRFGTYRSCRRPDPQSGTPGIGILYRNLLGYRHHLCPHGIGHHLQHHRLS